MAKVTPTSSKLVLDYGDDGKYTLGRLNPKATDENLFKMASAVARFQDGTCQEVLNYVDVELAE